MKELILYFLTLLKEIVLSLIKWTITVITK